METGAAETGLYSPRHLSCKCMKYPQNEIRQDITKIRATKRLPIKRTDENIRNGGLIILPKARQ
jgi:hypothetical protein